MKNVMIFAFALSVIVGCNAQNKMEENQHAALDSTTILPNPRVQTRVNRKYDENGNLIAFDSVYTSYSTNSISDSLFMDSIMQDFKPYFNQHFPAMMGDPFNDMFFQDSLLQHDFFYDDFFKKRFELNQKQMDQMLNQMDSIKNSYFKEWIDKKGQEAPEN